MADKKLLIIGSTPHQGIGTTYGGTTILMQSFLDYCQEHALNYEFIQANKHLGRLAGLRNLLFVLGSLLFKIRTSDVVMLNAASRGAFYVAPILYGITRCFNKKFVFRKFGGNFHRLFQEKPKWQQRLLQRTILKADILFFETLEMADFFKTNFNITHVHWLPNVRKRTVVKKITDVFERKFVFISHIKRTKGVIEILDAANSLPDNYTIDLYGPLMDEAITVDTFRGSNANYRGVLSPQEVIPTLANYDVLLLPSYHPGEGYPGIIIEALSLGMPVIAANWNAIPEIIEDGHNGLLIPIKDSVKLGHAIHSFNPSDYQSFSKRVLASFEKFHDEKVYKEIVEIMHAC